MKKKRRRAENQAIIPNCVSQDEKLSLNLPSSNSKIEFINSGGIPDGFIGNDNQSSNVSGSFKYNDTDDFERQVSRIPINNNSRVSNNNANNNSDDILFLVKQFKNKEQKIDNEGNKENASQLDQKQEEVINKHQEN